MIIGQLIKKWRAIQEIPIRDLSVKIGVSPSTLSRIENGYGMFRFNGKWDVASRVSWIIKYGKIPKGLSVLHKCDNRGCVNPDHLFLGTYSDNARDREAKGRSRYPLIEKFKAQTTCSNGHEYDFIDYKGHRICRLCRRTNLKDWRHKKGISKVYRGQTERKVS